MHNDNSPYLRHLAGPIVFLLLCLAAFSLGTTPAFAETYTWVDEQGVRNYSQRKPRNVPDAMISVVQSRAAQPSSGAIDAPQATNQPAQPELVQATTFEANPELTPEQQSMLQDLNAAQEQRNAEIAKIRQDNCQISRQVLSNLTAGPRIRVRDASGAPIVMPEDERQQRIRDAQQAIVENC